ncbi:riboflavin synthase [Algiphilus aromaticivorans]|jgi:riboflavin synthase|uniref:riboflavin synthase n=1 Tax=Algiphilus aromaticivorans TaxID=382454 RepID=UPI0005C1462C|nr:riboflavin synthase [Algiphilus aromaticivorans]
MFTGLIEAMGRLEQVSERDGDRRLRIVTPSGFLEGVEVGASIATSGVCLTAVALDGDVFEADVSVETLDATTAREWEAGRPLNLEHSLTLAKPLGGHLVSGHVDGVGRLVDRQEDARSWRLELEVPEALSRYIARKGSVAVDGISLTVNDVEGSCFGVNIVPHTWAHTTLGTTEVGAAVNIEVDLIARYTERLLAAGNGS